MTHQVPRPGGRAFAWLPVGFVLASCSTAYWSTDADTEVNALLAVRTRSILGDRAETVVRPADDPERPAKEVVPADKQGQKSDTKPNKQKGEQKGEQKGKQLETSDKLVQKVDLATALRLAVQHNRDYKTRRESLYLTGLSTTLSRFDFGPQLDTSLSGSFNSREAGDETTSGGATFGIDQILPTGGLLALIASASRFHTRGLSSPLFDQDDYGTSVALELNQPLLRGFGYENSHNPLIQAERSLVYGIRNFELFRQEFSITITESYYELVRQKATLVNDERDYAQAVFDNNKAEAFRKVDRNDDTDVFRAQRREIEANDALISGRAAFRRAREAFTIQLGLPTSTTIEIVTQEPEYQLVRTNVESAIVVAKRNRLDLKNQSEQLDDARRSLRIAENGMLPDASLVLRTTWSGDSARLRGAAPDEWDNFVGFQMNIPLQRTRERNRLRAAQIELEQALRAYDETLDQIELDIRDQIRQLHSFEQRVVLQESQIRHQRRAVTISEMRYESGDLENRDLLEARQSLIDAQNALIGLKVSHFIGRLRLLRSLGILFIDEKGGW